MADDRALAPVAATTMPSKNSTATSPTDLPAAGQVDLWQIDLEPEPAEVDRQREILTPEERKRADRFHFQRHRRRFAVRRGAMRSILGGYLDQDPSRVEIEVGEHGKPFLNGPNEADLVFNLTDSEDQALLAVATGCRLGVDIEKIQEGKDLEPLARRFFAASEHQVLMSLPESERPHAFYRAWTRKEAVLKATGLGISGHLNACVVTLRPDEPARIVELGEHLGRVEQWTLLHLDLRQTPPGFFGAVAVERKDVEVRWFPHSID